MAEIENEGFAPEIYEVMKKNMEMADKLGRPSCQDTGIPQFFARVGTKFPYLDEIEPALIDELATRMEREGEWTMATAAAPIATAADLASRSVVQGVLDAAGAAR